MGLDTVEFVMDIEKEFSIEIPDEDAMSIGLVREIADYIEVKLKRSNRERSYSSIVEKLKGILVSNYSIPRDKIDLKSHVVFDLGLD